MLLLYKHTYIFRSADRYTLNGFRGIAKISYNHNHPILSSDALKHRDVSATSEDILVSMYKDGATPAKALERFKSTLQYQLDDSQYAIAAADRSIVPDKQFCYR